MSDFFASRWVPRPAHVCETGVLPSGFRAAGVACGVKSTGALDLGLLVSDVAGGVSAARFCDSGVLAAPVVVTRERCNLRGLRAVVANAGNANAATGAAGVDEAVRVQAAAAAALGLDPREVAVASTGVIGVALPGERIAARVPTLVAALRPTARTTSRRRSARRTRSTSTPTWSPRCRRATFASPSSARAPG